MSELNPLHQEELNQYKLQMSNLEFDRVQIEGALKCFESSLNWKETGAIKPTKPSLIKAKMEFLQQVLEADDSIQEKNKKLQEIDDEDISRKFLNILESAKRRGKEFNLTLGEVKKLLNRKTCYYTGMKLVKALPDQVENPVDNARTFDRIDNSKGYVIGNVVACSHWSNQLKNTLFEAPDGIALNREKDVKKLLEKLL